MRMVMDFVRCMDGGIFGRLRSWLRPHRGISQEKLLVLRLFEFVHNTKSGAKPAESLVETLLT